MLQELRCALRQFAKQPGFSAIAVLILAVGLAFSVALFGFVDAAIIRPLPYRNPNRLAYVTGSVPQFPRARLSYLDFVELERSNAVFQSIGVYLPLSISLRTSSGTEPVNAIQVSEDFLHMLGTAPMLGRDFSADRTKSIANELILSYASWKQRFGARSDVIGQQLAVGDESAVIVGVLPQSFEFAPGDGAEFWFPFDPAAGGCQQHRGCHNLQAIARLRDDVRIESAAAEMKIIAARLEREYPATDRGQGVIVVPLQELILGDTRPILLLLLGAAGLLLLMGCVNVATLLLVRSESRKHEVAVKRALGASGQRLVRQIVTESVLLVLSGGIIGILLSTWGMRLLLSLIPATMMRDMPYLQTLGFNPRVIAFAAAILLLSAILLAFVPGVRLVSVPLLEGLMEGGRSSASLFWRRFGQHLIRFELTIAVMLLVGAGLLSKSFYRLVHVDVGFRPQGLAVLQMGLEGTSVSGDDHRISLERQIVSRISKLPGVISVGIADRLPLSGAGNTEWIRVAGRPYHGEHSEVNERKVSSGYIETLRASMLRGNTFSESEDGSKPGVVIINQAFARKYFPGEDPIGKVIGDNDLSSGSLKQVIGIVDNIREGTLDSEDLPTVYWPFNQNVPHGDVLDLIVRMSSAEQAAIPELAAAVHEVNPDLAIQASQTMEERIYGSETAYLHRSSAYLVSGFAAAALLLGVIGLYGVISFSVSQRTREIGVRIALGAQRGRVYRLIMAESLTFTATGIIVGVGLALGAASLMGKLLFATPVWDLPTLLSVAAILGASALLATYIPARRAATVQPIEALRHE